MLSTNELRAHAAEFAREWKDAHYERGQAQTFYIEFFEVFGVKSRRVASFAEPVKKLGDKRGYIELYWRGTLIAEHKSACKNLEKAKQQALDYFPYLKEVGPPRYVLVCDFQKFELYDLDERTGLKFPLADFPQHVEVFNFILGKKKVEFRDQDPVNIIAAELVGKLHDALEASNYKGHDLERLRKAHHKLDAAVDALYRRTGFQSDRERVEHLFMLYEKLADPLLARAGKAKRAPKGQMAR